MKKLLYLLSFSIFFFSCSKDEEIVAPEEAQVNVEVQQSTALRFSLQQFKKLALQGTSKMTTESTELCFQFQYPIVLEYNDATQITVDTYEDLLQILLNETPELHLTAIGFPFDVLQYSTDTVMTVSNEDEFQNLVSNCGYDPVTVVDVVALTENCFSVNYPITALVNEQPQVFNNQTEAEDYFSANYTTIQSLSLQYPFSVNMIATGEANQINNDFELIYLINDTCGIN